MINSWQAPATPRALAGEIGSYISAARSLTHVKTWMLELRAAGVQSISPSLVLAEAAGAVSRRTGSPSLGRRALAGLQKLPGLRIVGMSNALVLEAASLAATLGLRGADSIYVAVAKRLRVPLVTLDSEQRERGRKTLAVQDLDG